MSTALQTPEAPAVPASPRTRLVVASLAGALFVLGGLALAGYVVPTLWETSVAPVLKPVGGFLNAFLRILVQGAVVGGVAYAGTRFAGNNPPKGLRGGIFLCVSLVVAIFFIARAVGLNLEGSSMGPALTAVVVAAMLFGAYKLLVSARGERYMHSVEDQGWLHTHQFKHTQGRKVRRATLIGILIVGVTGAWAIYSHRSLGTDAFRMAMPFGLPSLVPLDPVEFVAPVLVILVTFWFAWRAVNVPVFADFLIATEAEMNKVSWSTRRRLYQDTIVTLVTLLLMTVFLMVVDLFWGWLLSRSFIGVLPSRQDAKNIVAPNQKPSW